MSSWADAESSDEEKAQTLSYPPIVVKLADPDTLKSDNQAKPRMPSARPRGQKAKGQAARAKPRAPKAKLRVEKTAKVWVPKTSNPFDVLSQ